MNAQTITITRILTWSGLIPFFALALVAVVDAPDWLKLMLTAYAALILSFMAGTLWGRQLAGEQAHPRMLIASNILVLAAWPALLLPVALAACWLALLFGAHLLLEAPWRSYGMPGWYRRLRMAVSVVAIILLLTGGLIGIGVGFNE